MPGKGPGETSTVNAQVYTEILDTFLIPSIENGFVDEVIFQDHHASRHRAKSVKAFLQERQISSMTWPANFKKLVHNKAPSCKTDLSYAIQESLNQLDGEYCFSLVQSMP